MSKTIHIGKISAEPGTKYSGFLEIGHTSTSPVRMPVSIINGENDGPKVCIIAGIHGCEYSSIEAVIKLIEICDPLKMNGSLIIVPVANMPSFEARTAFVSPLDNLDLNRIFPGNKEGSISNRIAYAIFNDILPYADYLIDCHGGDLPEKVAHAIIISEAGSSEVNAASRNLANQYNTKWIRMKSYMGSTYVEAPKRGIPTITVEAGAAGLLLEECVQFHFDGMINILKFLKIIPGQPTPVPDKRVLREVFPLTAEIGGIFVPQVVAGDVVSKGQPVASVKDVFGNNLSTTCSSTDGVVTLIRIPYPINQGDVLLMVTAFDK